MLYQCAGKRHFRFPLLRMCEVLAESEISLAVLESTSKETRAVGASFQAAAVRWVTFNHTRTDLGAIVIIATLSTAIPVHAARLVVRVAKGLTNRHAAVSCIGVTHLSFLLITKNIFALSSPVILAKGVWFVWCVTAISVITLVKFRWSFCWTS